MAQDRKEILTRKLIEVATARIARDGVETLKARDLAGDAQVSVGSIYTVFKDLDALMLAVNAMTFRAMGAHIRQAVLALPEDAPTSEPIVTMALSYLDFAQTNTRLWLAMFENRLTPDTVPDWYMAEVQGLFDIISGPLRVLRPELDETDVALLTRGLFGSIHGVVLLNVQNRISAVPRDQVRRVIELILRSVFQSDATSA